MWHETITKENLVKLINDRIGDITLKDLERIFTLKDEKTTNIKRTIDNEN